MEAEPPERISRTYRFVMAACAPITRWWGRLEVAGEDVLPTSGPLLVVGNHDSLWDPVAIGTAGRTAAADPGAGQGEPLEDQAARADPRPDGAGSDRARRRRRRSARRRRRSAPRRRLHRRLPRGNDLARRPSCAPRSGAARLAQQVPEARIVCVATIGTVDIFKFPKRPRITIEFFDPEGGQPRPDEDPAALSARLLEEIRAKAPISKAGRS